MILDQSIGKVAASDYFAVGWAWNWLSGEFVAPATLVGQWSNVIALRSENKRMEIYSSNARLEIGEKGKSERLEL